MIQKLLDRLAGKNGEIARKQDCDFRQLVVVAAENEESKLSDADLDWAAETLKECGKTIEDLQANVTQYRRVVALQEQGAKREELAKRASSLDKKYVAEDLKEGQRHREALNKLLALESERDRAILEAGNAAAAAADYYALIEPPEEYCELTRHQGELQRQIKQHEEAIDGDIYLVVETTGGAGHCQTPSGLWANISKFPALLARQTLEHLKRGERSLTRERKNELEGQLEAAQREVERRKKALQNLHKEVDAIGGRMEKIMQAQLADPKNFRMVKAGPTRDELKKQHAAKFGLGANDPGIRITTGR